MSTGRPTMTYSEAVAIRSLQLSGGAVCKKKLALAIALIRQKEAPPLPPAPQKMRARQQYRPEDTQLVKRLRTMLRRSGG